MKKFLALLVCGIFLTGLFGCAEKENAEAPVLEVGEDKVFSGEFNFYLETSKTQIEDEIGSGIDWEKDKLSGVLILDVAKENARKNVIKYKVLSKEAKRLSLLPDEKLLLEAKKSVTDVFNEDELSKMGIDEKTIEVIVSDIVLEKLLYKHYKQDENILNITEDELRAKYDYNLSISGEVLDFDDETTKEALKSEIIEERIKAKYEELILSAEVK